VDRARSAARRAQCLDDLEELHCIVHVAAIEIVDEEANGRSCSSECASEESAILLLGILVRIDDTPARLPLRFSGPAASSRSTAKSSVRLTLFLEAR
jgi:hypothetical protein